MKTPTIIVNFKAYPNDIGAGAVALAKTCEKISKVTHCSIAVACQPTDVYRVATTVGIPVFSQHIDALGVGAKTGWLLPESVKASKGSGSLLNHSEHRVGYENIRTGVIAMKKLGLTSIVCASTLAAVKKIALLKPDFIAYEPSALIGGKVSVSSAKPAVIAACAKAVGKKSKLLVGAGVHTAEDVSVALSLGAHGVLVASGVDKAKSPKRALLQLVKGLKN